jgi:tRNA U38,U39,U40 pseudouridine synthase TruA
MGQLRVLDVDAGDVKVVWDASKEAEVEAAREQFNKLTGKKNYIAYTVKKDGGKGKKITEFDPEAEMIILAPLVTGG